MINPALTKQRLVAAQVKNVPPEKIAIQFWLSLLAALVLLGVGLGLAFSAGTVKATFTPSSAFDRFAAFYVVTQAIERFVAIFSPMIPPYGKDEASKDDRAVIVTAGTFLIGVAVARWSGLLFLQTIGWSTPSSKMDILVTGLVVSGGTKALHDLIGNIQKPPDTTPAAPTTSQ